MVWKVPGNFGRKGDSFINRVVVIEGMILLGVGFLSLREGLKLISEMDPTKLSDAIGPGAYIVAYSICLLIVGAAYLVLNFRKKATSEGVPVEWKNPSKVLKMVASFVIYNVLIELVGYLIATILFFLMQFKIVGVRSWRTIFLLSLIGAAVYYILFEKYCSIIFPHGILF
jgi:putative tricarboxylic transport membrane protein